MFTKKKLLEWFSNSEKHVLTIAEAGINHNGDIDIALDMVSAARAAGADVIKFQSFSTNRFLSPGNPIKKIFQKCQLSEKHHKLLKEKSKRVGILVSSTPLDTRWVTILDSLNFDILKVASGDITFLPMLEKIAHTKRPVVLSTGMSTIDDIKTAVDKLRTCGATKIAILHCVSSYPPDTKELNLASIQYMKDIFPDYPIGFSDHTAGIGIARSAVLAGARIIEKHFTIDKKLPGPDHSLSLLPHEFKDMVKSIREAKMILGDRHKKPTKKEQEIVSLTRRGAFASRSLYKGDKVSKNDIIYLRPEGEINPLEMEKYIGKRLKKDVPKNTPLKKIILY